MKFKENKHYYIAILVIFVLAIIFAGILSPFASSNPDGLDKVAEEHSLLTDDGGSVIYQSAPMADYSISFIENSSLSTALSGIIGILICLFLVFSLFWVINLKRK